MLIDSCHVGTSLGDLLNSRPDNKRNYMHNSLSYSAIKQFHEMSEEMKARISSTLIQMSYETSYQTCCFFEDLGSLAAVSGK